MHAGIKDIGEYHDFIASFLDVAHPPTLYAVDALRRRLQLVSIFNGLQASRQGNIDGDIAEILFVFYCDIEGNGLPQVSGCPFIGVVSIGFPVGLPVYKRR